MDLLLIIIFILFKHHVILSFYIKKGQDFIWIFQFYVYEAFHLKYDDVKIHHANNHNDLCV